MREEQVTETGEAGGRFRQYTGRTKKGITVFLCLWAVFQLYFTTVGVIGAVELRAVHGLFLLVCTFLLFPSHKKERRGNNEVPLYDRWWIVVSVSAMMYFLWRYTSVAESGGRVTDTDLIVAGIALACVFEAARRASGNLAILALLFLAYGLFGDYLPGLFGHNGFTVKRILITQFWGTEGIFGTGIGVSATYIFIFVLLGSFLQHSGFSRLVHDMALTLAGQSAGGPAKVAVAASGVMGMINGSAVANVATTGVMTIPLMKRSGYPKEWAAAVEATASTGGQFTPPVMGAVGFVMAEFLRVPYATVAWAAALPAFLYYAGLFFAVHLEAKKRGLSGVSAANIPRVRDVVRERGHAALPVFSLVGLMAAGFTPLYAAVLSVGVAVVASRLRKETAMTAADVVKATAEGARSAVEVGMCCLVIGVIIGTVTLTSLGLQMGYWILSAVGDTGIYMTGFWVMVISVVLGMGVPGVAAYVIVQAVAVPVLVKAGAIPLTAHLFCLIYACLSNITPPVAVSSYVASGIAGSNQMKTALLSVRLGIIGFLIPFFFLDHPVLLLGTVYSAGLAETAWAALTALLGTAALVCAAEGRIFHGCTAGERLVLVVSALCLLLPGIGTDLIGLAGLMWAAWVQGKGKGDQDGIL